MDTGKCTLFTSLSGNMFAAIMHFLCALSLWCCLAFLIVPILFFIIEKNPEARKSCVHAILICLAIILLALLPTIVWLIILAASGGTGVFFIICTVIFALVLLMLMFVFFIIEVVCGVKALRKEPVEIPFISKVAERISHRV